MNFSFFRRFLANVNQVLGRCFNLMNKSDKAVGKYKKGLFYSPFFCFRSKNHKGTSKKPCTQREKKCYNRNMKAIQIGFFDEENRYKKLTELGDPLEKLNSVMN